MFAYETQLLKKMKYIAGGDEAGRGCLAGPVVSALVILDPKNIVPGIRDSKKMTEKERERLFPLIMDSALSVSVGVCDNNVIDKINILEATKKAFVRAYKKMAIKPQHLLLDALDIAEIPLPQTKLFKGESKSYSIAAASIIAKVSRDRMMLKFDKKFPGYEFALHKGYGTKKHVEALEKLGPISIHRMTFKPIRKDDPSKS